jgi:hypothetical protein
MRHCALFSLTRAELCTVVCIAGGVPWGVRSGVPWGVRGELCPVVCIAGPTDDKFVRLWGREGWAMRWEGAPGCWWDFGGESHT